MTHRTSIDLAMRSFLARFLGRGWLHALRDSEGEQAAVDMGIRKGWLRREMNEAHFTPEGRRVLEAHQ